MSLKFGAQLLLDKIDDYEADDEHDENIGQNHPFEECEDVLHHSNKLGVGLEQVCGCHVVLKSCSE
jgi:hypothetical protein